MNPALPQEGPVGGLVLHVHPIDPREQTGVTATDGRRLENDIAVRVSTDPNHVHLLEVKVLWISALVENADAQVRAHRPPRTPTPDPRRGSSKSSCASTPPWKLS